MKEITLKELLETTFTINEKGEMGGEFTLKRINMIGDILTNQYKEIERLKSNEKTLADLLDKEQKEKSMYKSSFETMSENYFEEQKKNKKAIEYLEYYCIGNLEYENKTHKKLLDILKGDDRK